MSDASSAGDPRPARQHATPGVWAARAIAALVGLLCFVALPSWLGGVTRAVAAWDLAVLVLVGEGWFVILRSNPERPRQ
jgi:hypothetical protein